MGDVAVSVIALAIALFLRYGGVPEPFLIKLYAFASPFLITLWLAGFLIFGLYDLKSAKNEPRFFEKLAKAFVFNLVITILLFYFIPAFRLKPLVALFFIFGTLGLFTSCWRVIYNAVLARRTKERILFFGMNDEAVEVTKFLAEHPQIGFKAVACLIDGGETMGQGFFANLNIPIIRRNGDLVSLVEEYDINRVVVTQEIKDAEKLTEKLTNELFGLVPLGVTMVDLSRFYESIAGKVPTSLINKTWFIENLIGMKRPKYDLGKRILDLIIVFILALPTLIALPVMALAILISSPQDVLGYKERRAREGDGPIFFRQKRVGKNRKVFDFIKFRSQVLGAEKMGGYKDMTEDPRAYPVGTFLRKVYLDELPQLWNVFVGEMSFVGPRPERPEFAAKLEREIPFYRMRELVLPGITGWAQINMENDASVEDAPEKLQYDLYYIKNRSIALDVAILLKTALKLLQRSGR